MTDVYYRPHQQATLIKKESTYGSAETPDVDVGLVQSLSFDESNTLQQHKTLGARATQQVSAGAFEISGSMTVHFQHGRLLELITGGTVTHDDSDTPDIKHTYAEASQNLPGFTLHDGYNNAGGDVLQTYAGCMITDATIGVNYGEPVTITANFLAKTVADTTTATAASIDSLEVLRAEVATVTIGSQVAGAQSFELKINNNTARHMALGSRALQSATAGMVDYEFTFTCQFLNQTEYERFLGSSSPASGTPSDFTVVLNVTNGVAAGSGLRQLHITLNNASYGTSGRPVNVGDEMIVQTFTGVCKSLTMYSYDDITSGNW